MRVAAIQMSSQGDVPENLGKVSTLVEEAKVRGARLVCLPEGFAFLGREGERRRVAEELGKGPISHAVAGLCRRHGVSILAGGMPERAPDEARPFNTSALFTPEGELACAYRKIHLFDVDLNDGTRLKESAGSSAGSEVCTTTFEGVMLGLSICYDLRFPLLYQRQREAGAQLLTVPAAFTATTGAAHWEVLLRARAIETQCFLVAPAQVGEHPYGRKTYGHSLIVGPWGDVRAVLPAGEGVIDAELDLSDVGQVRRQMPVFEHRRL